MDILSNQILSDQQNTDLPGQGIFSTDVTWQILML